MKNRSFPYNSKAFHTAKWSGHHHVTDCSTCCCFVVRNAVCVYSNVKLKVNIKTFFVGGLPFVNHILLHTKIKITILKHFISLIWRKWSRGTKIYLLRKLIVVCNKSRTEKREVPCLEEWLDAVQCHCDGKEYFLFPRKTRRGYSLKTGKNWSPKCLLQVEANIILVNIVGRDFTRIMACVLNTVKWKLAYRNCTLPKY